MMAQDLPLFMQPPAARRRDPETSHQAESWLRSSGVLAQQERAVLAALKEHPGCTSQELARHLPFGDRYVTSRRLAGLANAGLAQRGPKRYCHVSRMACITWFAVTPGRVATTSTSTRPGTMPAGPQPSRACCATREPAPVLTPDEKRRLRERLAAEGSPEAKRFLAGLCPAGGGAKS